MLWLVLGGQSEEQTIPAPCTELPVSLRSRGKHTRNHLEGVETAKLRADQKLRVRTKLGGCTQTPRSSSPCIAAPTGPVPILEISSFWEEGDPLPVGLLTTRTNTAFFSPSL